MFSKKNRVSKSLFLSILEKGKIISSPVFLFKYIKSNDSRIAFVASKTVSKLAIGRNKLRRQGYSALREIGIPLGYNGIFFYKKGNKDKTFGEIKENVDFIVNKLKKND